MKDITRQNLENIVPERIFWRGEDLYNEGAVQKVVVSERKIAAKIEGSRLYSVEAELTGDGFLFSCTCPYDDFCKHRIALGLWMIDHKKKLAKMKPEPESVAPEVNIKKLLKKASAEQKEQFLTEALMESPMLLSRFQVMVKGPEKSGDNIKVDILANEIKTAMESFDLTDYTRFYESEPSGYGYREEWQVLQDGAEAEFEGIFNQYKDKTLELLEIRNVLAASKYLLAIYEAVKTADFESVDDPVCIFEGDGFIYVLDREWEYLFNQFTTAFAQLSFKEDIYLRLIDLFFERFKKGLKKQIYRIGDFITFLQICIKTEKTVAHLFNHLKNKFGIAEEEYCELLLTIHERTDNKEAWLDTAQKYYTTNQAVAEKLLNHFVKDKDKLVQFAQQMAFRFDGAFIPFFYKNLSKKNEPDLYRKILFAQAKSVQTVALYREIKKEYGADVAGEFINSLEEDWSAERFYIQLLREEKDYEKLLSLAQKKSKSSPAMAYLRPIVDIYPQQVFEIISLRAERYLGKNIGRNFYRQTAEWLRLLKKINDEQVSKKVTFFINHLLDKFKKRPAMKDEFVKAGLINR